MAVLLAWVTFPAGGVYPWVWIPGACATLLLALGVYPGVARDERVRSVDLMLMLTVLAIATQLAPLSMSILQGVDPNAIPLRRALWLLPAGALDRRLRLPVSIVPGDTLAALGIFSATALLFWTCRHICELGGTGRIVRSIAVIGLAASLAGIAQGAQHQELLYGFWRPIEVGARPYGPFVNRNHFATWAIMACPLIYGYLLARAPAARKGQPWTERIVSAAKQLGSIRIWLAASVCLLTLAVLISTSRSGLIGLMAAFALSGILSRGHYAPRTRRWMIFQGVLLTVVVVSFANFDALVARFDATFAAVASNRGRTAVWRDAVRLIGDFPLTGTGAVTFGAAIIPYQTAEPGYRIGQAHNHYLQIAAEGGCMVVVPAALSVAAFLLLFRRRLMEDHDSDFLIRAGAGAGMAGALLQSFWDTGLRMPANAMLLAVLAAIATHAGPVSTNPVHRAS